MLAVMKDATTVSGWAYCWVVGKVCCLAKKKELGTELKKADSMVG